MKDTNVCIYLLFSFFNWRIIAYSIVLVSALQWHESDMSLHVSLSLEPPSYLSSFHWAQAEIPVL